MKISVIIPTLNEQDMLPKAIRAIPMDQVHEVIVCDGGSRDGTRQIAKSSGCHLIESDIGRGNQLAEGADNATGDLFLFLHADSVLTPSCIDQLHGLADNQYWGGFRHKIDAPQWRFRLLEKGNHLRVRIRGLVYGDQSMWVRAESYRKAGGFPRVPLMEDVRMSEALKQYGPPHLLPGPVSISARHWRRKGVLMTTLRNQLTMGLYRCGCSPDRIARYYRR